MSNIDDINEFTSNLNDIINKALEQPGATQSTPVGVVSQSDMNILLQLFSNNQAQVTNLLFNGSNTVPSDFNQFVSLVIARASSLGAVNAGAIVNAFVASFRAFIGYPNDWTPALTQNNPNPITDADLANQFFNAWRAFVNAKVASSPSGEYKPTNFQNFAEDYRRFLVQTTTVSNEDSTITSWQLLIPQQIVLNTTYEQLFNSYFPGAANTVNPDDPLGRTYFQQVIQSFYRKTLRETSPDGNTESQGYFMPSLALGDWITNLKALYEANQNALSFVSEAGLILPQTKTRILNNILLLLIEFINTLQNVAASQANRLALYTSWQRGYTDVLNQIPTFTGQSSDFLADAAGGRVAIAASLLLKVRQDVQSNFNAQLTQKVTANKDVVTDDAKALQSQVNQSSDAFNQQANVATAILQQLSTILSAIFR